ncbi:hypothetical protein [uncultured Secundilactobacillus sp.]|uniref:hypothetical protein n=1 Tax=uncultured Secundilactobacillus sp. TaxID=2813935 RepID=UPI00258E782B|nr:hypothetical protein [uncultured Secundilactobacillus sp.]
MKLFSLFGSDDKDQAESKQQQPVTGDATDKETTPDDGKSQVASEAPKSSAAPANRRRLAAEPKRSAAKPASTSQRAAHSTASNQATGSDPQQSRRVRQGTDGLSKNSIQTTIAPLTDKLEAVRGEIKTQLFDYKDQLNVAFTAAQRQIDEAQATLASHEQEMAKLEKRRQVIEEQIAPHVKKIETLKAEQDDNRKQVIKLNGDLEKLNTQKTTLSQKSQKLLTSSAKSSNDEDIDQVGQHLAELTKQLSDLRDQVAELDKQTTPIEKQLKEARQKRESIDGALKKAQETYEKMDLRKDRQQTESRYKRLTQELDRLKETRDAAKQRQATLNDSTGFVDGYLKTYFNSTRVMRKLHFNDGRHYGLYVDSLAGLAISSIQTLFTRIDKGFDGDKIQTVDTEFNISLLTGWDRFKKDTGLSKFDKLMNPHVVAWAETSNGKRQKQQTISALLDNWKVTKGSQDRPTEATSHDGKLTMKIDYYDDNGVWKVDVYRGNDVYKTDLYLNRMLAVSRFWDVGNGANEIYYRPDGDIYMQRSYRGEDVTTEYRVNGSTATFADDASFEEWWLTKSVLTDKNDVLLISATSPLLPILLKNKDRQFEIIPYFLSAEALEKVDLEDPDIKSAIVESEALQETLVAKTKRDLNLLVLPGSHANSLK